MLLSSINFVTSSTSIEDIPIKYRNQFLLDFLLHQFTYYGFLITSETETIRVLKISAPISKQIPAGYHLCSIIHMLNYGVSVSIG